MSAKCSEAGEPPSAAPSPKFILLSSPQRYCGGRAPYRRPFKWLRNYVPLSIAVAALVNPAGAMKIRREITNPVFAFSLDQPPEKCSYAPDPRQVDSSDYFIVECVPEVTHVKMTFTRNPRSQPVFEASNLSTEISDLEIDLPEPSTDVTGSVVTNMLQLCETADAKNCRPIQIDAFRNSDEIPRLAQRGLSFSRTAEEAPTFKPSELTYHVKLFTGEPTTVFVKAAPGFFVDASELVEGLEKGFTDDSITMTITPKGPEGKIERRSVYVTNKSHGAQTEYIIEIENVRSIDPRLADVSVSPGRLDPLFRPETYAYFYRVPEGTSHVNLHVHAVNARDTRCYAMPLGLITEPANDPAQQQGFFQRMVFWRNGAKSGNVPLNGTTAEAPNDGIVPEPRAPQEPVALGGDGKLTLKLPKDSRSTNVIIDCVAADETYKVRYVLTVVQQFGGSTQLTQLELLNGPFDRPFDPNYAGPYRATLTQDKDRWVVFRVDPQNARAECTVDGYPVDNQTELSPYFRVSQGDSREFLIRVRTPENPVAEEYSVIVKRPGGSWFSNSKSMNKLAEWIGITSSTLSATRAATFLANAKFLQFISMTGRINGIPESHDAFSRGLHKYNLQWVIPGFKIADETKNQSFYWNWGESNPGVHIPQSLPAHLYDERPHSILLDAVENAVAPNQSGSNWEPAFASSPENLGGAVAAALAQSRRLQESAAKTPQDHAEAGREFLVNLDAAFKAQEAMLHYSTSIILTTVILGVVAVLYGLIWALYLRDVREGWTTLRQDFPAVLKPSRFWTFLFDYSLIAYLQSGLGILFAPKAVRDQSIKVFGLFHTTPAGLSIFAAIILIAIPLAFLVAGLIVLVQVKRDIVFSSTLQRHHDGQCAEIKAHRRYLSWLPILSNLFTVEITSVAPITRHPTTRPGMSDGPLRFEEDHRTDAPWNESDPKRARMIVSQMDPEKGQESLLRPTGTRHEYDKKADLLHATIPDDLVEVRPDTLSPSLYTRFPDALIGHAQFGMRNAYDQALDLHVQVQLRYLPHLLNVQGYSLLVPRTNLRQDSVDAFNLLFAKSSKGNFFSWGIDRILTTLLIAAFSIWRDKQGWGHLILFAALTLLAFCINIPAVVKTGLSFWFDKMERIAMQQETQKQLDAAEETRCRKIWPFRRTAALVNFEKLREMKVRTEMFGMYNCWNNYVSRPWQQYVTQNNFWNTRLATTIFDAGMFNSILMTDFCKFSILGILVMGNRELGPTLGGGTTGLFVLLNSIVALFCLNTESFTDWKLQLTESWAFFKMIAQRSMIHMYDFFSEPGLMTRKISHFFSSCQRALRGERGVNFTYPGFSGEKVRDFIVNDVVIVNNETGVHLPGTIAASDRWKHAQRKLDSMEKQRFGLVKTLHLAGSVRGFERMLDQAMPVQLPFKQFYYNGLAETDAARVKRLVATIQITNYDESRGASGHTHLSDDDSFLSLYADRDLLPEYGVVRSKTAGHGYVVRYVPKDQAIHIRGPGIVVEHSYTITSVAEKPPPAVDEDLQSEDSLLTIVPVGHGGLGTAMASCRSSGIIILALTADQVPDLSKPVTVSRPGEEVIVIDPSEVKIEYFEYKVGTTQRREMMLRHRKLRAAASEGDESERADYTVQWTIKGPGKPINASARAPSNGFLSIPWSDPTPPDLSKFITLCDKTEGDRLENSVIDIDPRDTDAHQFIIPPVKYDGMTKLAAAAWNKLTRFGRTIRGRNLANEMPEFAVPCTIVQCVNPESQLFRVEPNFAEARLSVRGQIEMLLGRKADLDELDRLGHLWTDHMSTAEFVKFWENLGVSIVVRGAWINPITNSNHLYIKQNAARVSDGRIRFRAEIARRIDNRVAVLNRLHDKYRLWEKAYTDSALYSRFLARDAEEQATQTVPIARQPLLAAATRDYALQISGFQYPMTVEALLLSRREKFEAQLRVWREELSAWLFQMEGASMLSEQGGKSCVQATVDGALHALERSARRVEHAHSGLYRTVLHYVAPSGAVRGRETNWRPDPLAAHHAMVRLFPGDPEDPNVVHWEKASWTSCFVKLAADRLIILFPHELDARAPAPEHDEHHPTKRWNWNWIQAHYIPLQCFERFFLSIDSTIQEEPAVPDEVRRMHAKLVLKKNTEVHVDDKYVKSLYSGEFFDDVCYAKDAGQMQVLKLRLGNTVPNRDAARFPKSDDKFFHGDKCTVLPLTFRFHHSFFNKWQSAIRLAQLQAPRKVASIFDGRVLCDEFDSETDAQSELVPGGAMPPGMMDDDSYTGSSEDITSSEAEPTETSSDTTSEVAPSEPPEPAIEHQEGPVSRDVPIAAYKGEWQDGRYSGKNGRLVDETGKVVYDGDWVEGMRWGRGVCLFRDAQGVEWRFEGDFIADEIRKGRLIMVDEAELARLRSSTDPKDKYAVTEYNGVFALPSNARTVVGKRAKNLRRSGSNCAVRDPPQISSQFLQELFAADPSAVSGNKELVIDIRRAISACADTDTATATMAWVSDNYGKNKATRFSRQESQDDALSVASSSAITIDAENALAEYLPHRSRWARQLDPNLGYSALSDRFADGEVTFADGSRYRGQMTQGRPHGQGVMVCPPCDLIYAGEWKQGRPDGEGLLIMKPGDTSEREEYHGQFSAGKRQGRGIQLSKNGRILLKGEFNDDRLEGDLCSVELSDDVVPSYPNSYKRYVGAVKNNVLSGKGKLEWSDGFTYKGEFKESVRSGPGTMKNKTNKTVVSGTWARDLPEGRVMALVLPDGKVYTGDMRQGQRQGMGELYSKGVALYEGLWLNDVPNGRGTLYCPDGDYEGEFVNGKRHGKGRFEFKAHPLSNGKARVYEGDWRNDLPDGTGRYNNELGVENTYKFKSGELVSSSVKTYKSGVCGKAPVMGVKFFVAGGNGVTAHDPEYWGLKRRIDSEQTKKLHLLGEGHWARHEGKPFAFRDSRNPNDEAIAARGFDEASHAKSVPGGPTDRQLSADSLDDTTVAKGTHVLEVRVVGAVGLPAAESGKHLDPYCRVKYGRKMKRTKPINRGGSNPKWNATLVFAKAAHEWLEFEVWDKETLSRDELLGHAEYNLQMFYEGASNQLDVDIPLLKRSTTKDAHPEPAGTLKVQFCLSMNRFFNSEGDNQSNSPSSLF